MGETLAHLFDQAALRLGEKQAILFLRKGRLESQLTFSSLYQISNRAANYLVEMGLKKGDRAILFMPKSMDQVVFHLGVQKIGAISVILNPGFKKDEMDYFLKDTDSQVVIVGRKEEALIRSIAGKQSVLCVDTWAPFSEAKLFPGYPSQFAKKDATDDDPALLIYTSGTTGQPKGAVLTQRNLIQDAKNIIHIWEITEQEALCHALPLFHVHGLCFALHTSLMAGARIVMCDEFSPETTLDVLAHQKGDFACA